MTVEFTGDKEDDLQSLLLSLLEAQEVLSECWKEELKKLELRIEGRETFAVVETGRAQSSTTEINIPLKDLAYMQSMNNTGSGRAKDEDDAGETRSRSKSMDVGSTDANDPVGAPLNPEGEGSTGSDVKDVISKHRNGQ